jgi:RNA-directed DNA polymerase
MNIQEYLAKVIDEESDKLIFRYHAYHNALHFEFLRNKKRIANAPPKQIMKPDYWAQDKKFNPFYVKKKSKSIARSIAKQILGKL